MKLSREIFDRGYDSRGRPVYRVADDGIATVAHRVQNSPARAVGNGFEIVFGNARMGRGEHEVIRLQVNHFFQTHLRPVLARVNDGGRAGSAEGVGNESVLAHRNQGLGPYNKQDTLGRQRAELLLESAELALHVIGQGSPGFGNIQNRCELLGGRDDFVNGVRIGGIARDAQGFESAHGIEPVEALGDKNQVRVEGGNLFEVGVDGAAYLRLFLRVGRIVAVNRVADKAVLNAEGVKRFGEAGSKGDDS